MNYSLIQHFDLWPKKKKVNSWTGEMMGETLLLNFCILVVANKLYPPVPR